MTPPGAKNPEHFAKPPLRVGDVADAVAHHGGVEAAVGEGEMFGVALGVADPAAVDRFGHLAAAGGHHLPVDVADHHSAAGAHPFGGQNGQVPGAAADVQHPVAGLEAHHPHRLALPGVVNPEAEQGVHEVVVAPPS